ncbi:hypothetical protein RMSM_00677 [Rhodopirellula maiorica SM1]|uniref:Uncharacterized protein n=1 Tax=Rhodopirellula maiorica SM1 TaxID=1265738 RepID=M5S442_9BACT|nr:hypothetical protein RMSM_00677 [Rhodopirellula maiorica SM1]
MRNRQIEHPRRLGLRIGNQIRLGQQRNLLQLIKRRQWQFQPAQPFAVKRTLLSHHQQCIQSIKLSFTKPSMGLVCWKILKVAVTHPKYPSDLRENRGIKL